MATLNNGARATAGQHHLESTSQGRRASPDIPMEKEMRRIIATAALTAILATTLAACGGNGGDNGGERLHPVLGDATYLQVQEGREYVTMISYQARGDLSDRINAIHQGSYEIEQATSDEDGIVLLVFRKIPSAKESPSPTGPTSVT